jgi:hypothetical protein
MVYNVKMKCIRCHTEHAQFLRCPQGSVVLDQKKADESYHLQVDAALASKADLKRQLKHPSAKALLLRLDLKQRALGLKGGKCVLCGYHKCSRALEFHHLEKHQKSFTISAFIAQALSLYFKRHNEPTLEDVEKIWGYVVRELKKCILLCSNCHREVESGVTLL